MNVLTDSWSKNWPELRCAMSRGVPSFVLARRPRPPLPGVPVFHYHVVTAESLRSDLRFLKANGYVTATAQQLLDHMTGRAILPGNAVVLTFDDGPANLYTIAFPLIESFGVQVIAFICPQFHRTAFPRCRHRPCTWGEIRQMRASGLVEFHSHTLEHRYLPRWPQPVPLTGIDRSFVDSVQSAPRSMSDDFRAAREMIEDKLNQPVQHLACPRFASTPMATDIALDAGYQGIWVGTLPHRPDNRAGDAPTSIVRISGEFVRRLPGRGRRTLSDILNRRYGRRIRWIRRELLRR